MYKLLFIIFFTVSYIDCTYGGSSKALLEKPIVIVTASYNNKEWSQNYLNSLLLQNYDNFRVIYIDDNSKDGTAEALEKFLNDAHVDYNVVTFDDHLSKNIPSTTQDFVIALNAERHFFTLVRNVNRCGALANLYRAIQSCEDKEIIATVDGDDALAPREDVLKQLNEIYSTNEIWFTHGTLVEYPWGNVTWSEPVPSKFIDSNTFREFKCPSHLRTFYAWIFKKIKLEDFLYEGAFLPMSWDMAIMYPIAEMSGKRHQFITEVNYVYNMSNPINDNKVNADLQNKLDKYIRNKTRYQPLKKSEIK